MTGATRYIRLLSAVSAHETDWVESSASKNLKNMKSDAPGPDITDHGEQMSRLSSVLVACCSNHRLRPRPTRRGYPRRRWLRDRSRSRLQRRRTVGTSLPSR